MCNSLAMSGGASLIKVGSGTTGALMGYSATKQAAKLNRQIMEKNRQVSLQQSEIAKERGAQAVSKHRQQVRSLVGRQRAAYAAAGVLVGSGSPDQIVQQSRELGAADEAVIRRNTEQELWLYEMQREGIALQMDAERRRAKQASLNAGLAVGFNFLDAASRFGVKYYEWDEKNAKADPEAWEDPYSWRGDMAPPR